MRVRAVLRLPALTPLPACLRAVKAHVCEVGQAALVHSRRLAGWSPPVQPRQLRVTAQGWGGDSGRG